LHGVPHIGAEVDELLRKATDVLIGAVGR